VSESTPSPSSSDASSAPAPATGGAGKDTARRVATIVVGVLAAAALVAAGWFGYGWARALIVEKPVAEARDAALSGAMQAAVNLNSVDADDVDTSIENMRSSITGDALVGDLEATEQDIRDRVAETGTSMSAEVLFGTLTELNTDDDVAKALVVLAVRTDTPQFYVVNKVPVVVSMREDGGTWKAELIEPLVSTEMDAGVPPGATPPAPAGDPAAPAPAGDPAQQSPPEGEAGP